jgi:hypothetical protein
MWGKREHGRFVYRVFYNRNASFFFILSSFFNRETKSFWEEIKIFSI